MRFFHLSDLHIGLKLYNKDLYEDQEHVFRQIASYAAEEQPDAILIAGDIYDKAVPSAEAVELFDRFVNLLREEAPETYIMMISGNHDSASRVNIFRNVLLHQRVYMIGMPPCLPAEHIEKVSLKDDYGTVNFYLLPFVRPSMVKAIVGVDENGNNLSYHETLQRLLAREEIDRSQRNVLVSHQFYLPSGQDPEKVERMESEIVTVGNIDQVSTDVLEPFDYAALGHIHKPAAVGCAAYRYSGTPLPCSLSEAGQQKGVVLVEMKEKGNMETRILPLEPRYQVRKIRGTLPEVLEKACSDYVSICLTDKADLNVLDMQDRVRSSFPNLLEIRRELPSAADGKLCITGMKDKDPFSLCCSFLGELSEEEKELLRDVINTALCAEG